MTRAAAARAIAKAPEGQAIPRETILAAIPPASLLPDSERRYEGTVCLTWAMRESSTRSELIRFELDVCGVTRPRPGALAFAGFRDAHAYRFEPVVIGGPLGDGGLYGYRSESGFIMDGFRTVGCVVRWWHFVEGVRHGVDCPQGAPWGDRWRMGTVAEAEGHTLRRLDEGEGRRIEGNHVDERGVRL